MKTYTIIEITSTNVYFNKFNNLENATKYFKKEVRIMHKGYGTTQALLLTEGNKIWASCYRH